MGKEILLELVKGQTYDAKVSFYDEDGELITEDLSSASVSWALRESPDADYPAENIPVTDTDGNSGEGYAWVAVPASVMANIPAGKYKEEIKVTLAGGVVKIAQREIYITWAAHK
jgi:hypothetical protein